MEMNAEQRNRVKKRRSRFNNSDQAVDSPVYMFGPAVDDDEPLFKSMGFSCDEPVVMPLPYNPEEFMRKMSTKLDCHRCGICCVGLGVEVNEKDLEVEPRLRAIIEPKDYHDSIFPYTIPKGECKFFMGEDGCGIYETKPIKCRQWYCSIMSCMIAFVNCCGKFDLSSSMAVWFKMGDHPIRIGYRIMRFYTSEAKRLKWWTWAGAELLDGVSKPYMFSLDGTVDESKLQNFVVMKEESHEIVRYGTKNRK
jgi:hypothetical protein